ncbi:MAG: MOSC domain-containing protein [Pseudomonadota bacterium]
MTVPLAELMARSAQAGHVQWIGLRPKRRAALSAVSEAVVRPTGLEGDHGRAGKRAVTLIQAEHLAVIGAMMGGRPVAPEILRRNILVSGINLLALRKRHIRIGTALLEVTGPAAPCSRMEEALGHGGYSAMRGHGGMTAAVLSEGRIAVGDAVTPV